MWNAESWKCQCQHSMWSVTRIESIWGQMGNVVYKGMKSGKMYQLKLSTPTRERLSFLPSFELKVRWEEGAQMSSQAVGTVSQSRAVVREQILSEVCILSADTTQQTERWIWPGSVLLRDFQRSLGGREWGKETDKKRNGKSSQLTSANYQGNNSKLWVERITSKTRDRKSVV